MPLLPALPSRLESWERADNLNELVQVEGVVSEPNHWLGDPTPETMKRIGGTNPYGGNLFRIVFAPSVRMLCGGEFSDGFTGYRSRPAYRHIGSKWILEKWVSAWDFTQMNEEQYILKWRDPITGLIATGPYPSRGVYFQCHTFEFSKPGDGGVETIIALVNKAKLNDPIANARAIRATREHEERVAQQNRYDKIKDLMPVAGIRAANIGGRVKVTKSAPTPKTANELGLPIRGATQIRPEMHYASS
jgi:hypothetical protein